MAVNWIQIVRRRRGLRLPVASFLYILRRLMKMHESFAYGVLMSTVIGYMPYITEIIDSNVERTSCAAAATATLIGLINQRYAFFWGDLDYSNANADSFRPVSLRILVRILICERNSRCLTISVQNLAPPSNYITRIVLLQNDYTTITTTTTTTTIRLRLLNI